MGRSASVTLVAHDGDLTTNDVLELAEPGGPERVSLYLPTHLGRHEAAQDPIRLRRLLDAAAQELGDPTVLDPVAEWSEHPQAWTHGEGGLGILVDDASAYSFRLAEAVDELVVVGERFHLKPLVRAAGSAVRFDVLALSRHSVRLLRCTRHDAATIDVPGLPTGLPDALRYDDRERQLQSHSAGRTGRGEVTAAFHGAGGAADAHDADVQRFLQAVDHAVRRARASSTDPLVLAGVDELVAAFRSISRCDGVLDAHVGGNPDRLDPAELARRALPLVEAQASDDARTAHGAATAAPGGVRAVVAAATAGRVDTVVVPADQTCWGRVVDGDATAIHDRREHGDHDLFDVAAIETLRHGGRAFVVPATDVPGGEIAATLRY